MKLLFPFILFLFPFSLLAENELSFVQKIENAQTAEEKEEHYLEWVTHLSQSSNVSCDSVIKNRLDYITELSDNGKITLIITHFNNSRLGGSSIIPDITKYQLNKTDLLLVKGMIKCFTKEPISREEHNHLKLSYEDFDDPTRKSLFYAISTCLVDIDRQTKIDYFKKAIKHAKESPIKSMASSFYDIFSMFYMDIEDFEMAIHNQQKGISYAKKKQLTANTINHLVNIGHIHFELGNTHKAKECFLEGQELSIGLGLDFITGQLLNALGEVYNFENNLSKSIQYYQQSLIKFYNINNGSGLAIVHKNIGKAFFDNGDTELAKKNYELSYQFSKNIEGTGEKGELYYLMSELYLKENRLQLAELNIRKAIKYWEDKNHFIPANKAYLLYSKIKSEQGDFPQSNKYLNKYIDFSDSIYKLETDRKVAELSELFKSEQKERKIVEQEKKLEEEKSERMLIQNKLAYTNKQNQLILVILVISLSLFVAIFLIIRIRNKQEQLKKKQKEIELQQTLLRSQMNPHFIFNAMSVIQSYIYDEDIPNSSKFLVHFSKLMRLILENNTKEFISLDKEVEIINRYLVIQKMRFENRFEFTIEDSAIEDHSRISVPPMMVQPFLENAIEHGDLDNVKDGLIRVHCAIVGDLFIFTIEDNGVGRKAALQKKKSIDSEKHRSMAIELTKSRISLLNEKYKSKGYLRIDDLDKENQTGTIVTIATPFNKNY